MGVEPGSMAFAGMSDEGSGDERMPTRAMRAPAAASASAPAACVCAASASLAAIWAAVSPLSCLRENEVDASGAGSGPRRIETASLRYWDGRSLLSA